MDQKSSLFRGQRFPVQHHVQRKSPGNQRTSLQSSPSQMVLSQSIGLRNPRAWLSKSIFLLHINRANVLHLFIINLRLDHLLKITALPPAYQDQLCQPKTRGISAAFAALIAWCTPFVRHDTTQPHEEILWPLNRRFEDVHGQNRDRPPLQKLRS